jgi:hypothetical protein
MRIAMYRTFVISCAVMLSGMAFGQSESPVAPVPTFHIGGTITSSSGYLVDGAKITFQRSEFSKTVLTNNKGVYEVDLLLAGCGKTRWHEEGECIVPALFLK